MPANVTKIVDLGGGGDFSSTGAFVAWLYSNYPILDRNFRVICRSGGGNYADTSNWGSWPNVPDGYAVLFEASPTDAFDGTFKDTRFHYRGNMGSKSDTTDLIWCRIQFGGPSNHIPYRVYGIFLWCGIVSNATSPLVTSHHCIGTMIISTTSTSGITALKVDELVNPEGLHYWRVYGCLLVNRGGSSSSYGIDCYSGSNYQTLIANTIIDGFTTPVYADSSGDVATYCATTASSIAGDDGTCRKNQTFTYVDATNYNYVLSWNDTGAKGYGRAYAGIGHPVLSLNMVEPYGIKFYGKQSIGPTEPYCPTNPQWITKTVNTDGGGDFSSIAAALSWFYNNYPDFTTSNIKAKIICKGNTTDTANWGSLPITDMARYIHIIADDAYYFKGNPSQSTLYKLSGTIHVSLYDRNILIEGIKTDNINCGWYYFKNCWIVLEPLSTNLIGCFDTCLIERLGSYSVNADQAYYYYMLNCTEIRPNNAIIYSRHTNHFNVIIVCSDVEHCLPSNIGCVTSPNSAAGPYGKWGQTPSFRDFGNHDYRLSWNDTVAARQGCNLKLLESPNFDIELLPRSSMKPSYGMHDLIKASSVVNCTISIPYCLLLKYVLEQCKTESVGRLVKLVLELCRGAAESWRHAVSGKIIVRLLKPLVKVIRL